VGPLGGTARVEVVPEGERTAVASMPAAFTRVSGDRWMITATLPLSGLPPGAYTAVATVTLGGAPARVMTRGFRIPNP
jgi:hypothetical protein